MTQFSSVTKIRLPLSQVNKVYAHLQSAGSDGMEAVALWPGVCSNDTFEVQSTIIPEQTGYRIEEGLLYSVDGEELHRINVWLYQNQMTLMLQIHSHPGKAYHSETDDRYPIISEVGGISIVIPNFAHQKFSLKNWAVYRLMPSMGWVKLTLQQIKSLFEIIK